MSSLGGRGGARPRSAGGLRPPPCARARHPRRRPIVRLRVGVRGGGVRRRQRAARGVLSSRRAPPAGGGACGTPTTAVVEAARRRLAARRRRGPRWKRAGRRPPQLAGAGAASMCRRRARRRRESGLVMPRSIGSNGVLVCAGAGPEAWTRKNCAQSVRLASWRGARRSRLRRGAIALVKLVAHAIFASALLVDVRRSRNSREPP